MQRARLFFSVFVSALLVGDLLFLPSVYAGPVVSDWRGTDHPNVIKQDNGDGTYSFSVYDSFPQVGEELPCASGFDAACWSIGGNFGANPLSLSDLEKSYLSDPDFCPFFCAFADSFSNHGFADLILGYVTLPGAYNWSSTDYLYDDYLLAREEFNDVKSGNYPSHGGSGGAGSSWIGKSGLYASSYSSSFGIKGTDNLIYVFSSQEVTVSGKRAIPSTVTFTINDSCYSEFLSGLPTGTDYDLLPFVRVNSGSEYTGTSGLNYNLYAVPSGKYEYVYGNDLAGNSHVLGFRNNSGSSFNYYYVSKTVSTSFFTFDGTTLSIAYPSSFGTGSSYSLASGSSYSSSNPLANYFSFGGSAGGGGSGPTGGWPENPTVDPRDNPEVPQPDPRDPVVEPTPPELPTIGDPTVDPPDPTPDPPVTPIDEPTGTSPTDYTPWLRAILSALNKIDSDLSIHCLHLQKAMYDSAAWLYGRWQDYMHTLYTSFVTYYWGVMQWLVAQFDNMLDDDVYEMESWLRELFVWLSEQFDFSFTGGDTSVEGDNIVIDTSSIVYWLKRIYNAILGLSGNKPDIGNDSNGFWEWLNGILAGIVAGLIAGVLGIVGTFTDAIDSLTDKFPFSLPWDIAAMIALLAHDPVTPVFDLPLAVPDGSVTSVHVDFSDWDSVMASVRAMELLIFGYGLAKRTPDMLALADVL